MHEAGMIRKGEILMKATVVSIEGSRAAVLAHDGTFNEIKNHDYSIGQILDYKAQTPNIVNFASVHSKKIAAAAAAVMLTTGTVSANTYAYSTVTLDVNPSLRYELNVFDRVIGFDSFNTDGEEIVSDIRSDVLGKKIDNALEITLDALDESDYITEDTPVVVTVSSHGRKDDALKKKAMEEMNDWNEKNKPDNKSISGNTVIVTKDELKDAKEKNESPGRPILNEIKDQGIENGYGEPPVPETDTNEGERSDSQNPQSADDHSQPEPVNKDIREPEDRGQKPRDDQKSEPPADQGSQPSPDQGSEPPSDQGLQPPSDQGSQPPADQGSQPPSDQGLQPPSDQGSEPPPDQGSEPPSDQGSEPPADQGSEPPSDPGSQPPSDPGGPDPGSRPPM